MHRLIALSEYSVQRVCLGFGPEAETRKLTAFLWRLALCKARRGQFAQALNAWNLFRAHHTAGECLADFPPYLASIIVRFFTKK